MALLFDGSAAAQRYCLTLASYLDSGKCLITADHGNVEQMLDVDYGRTHTIHTLNPFPLILVSE
ncbi:hypothetical protein [Pseudomonas gingeri]|uniref:Metalloenzyme domain-containing protein n=1 Tax=Pseudomonas gingeri TaxID=117681 RepID=A0A7Y7WW92_9PSED|nr:hypothetical protein [Pseudomonas gingeri]